MVGATIGQKPVGFPDTTIFEIQAQTVRGLFGLREAHGARGGFVQAVANPKAGLRSVAQAAFGLWSAAQAAFVSKLLLPGFDITLEPGMGRVRGDAVGFIDEERVFGFKMSPLDFFHECASNYSGLRQESWAKRLSFRAQIP